MDVLFASRTQPGRTYTASPVHCQCPGWFFNHDCRHVRRVRELNSMVKKELTEAVEAAGGVAVVEPTAGGLPQSWDDFRVGADWESDGTEAITPSFPVIKIVQATSNMAGAGQHGGDFWHSDRETYEKELRVVGLLRRETRALFVDGSESPACISADGERPLANQPLWMGETFSVNEQTYNVPLGAQPSRCATCPFAQWINSAPPLCKNSDVLLVQREDGSLAQLRLSGKSIKPFNGFVAKKCRPRGIPLYAYRLTLATERKSEGANKRWYELQIAGELMTPTEAREYSDMLRLYRSQFEATLREGTGETAEPLDVTHSATPEGWKADYSAFWTAVKQLGFEPKEALAHLGMESVGACSQEELDSLLGVLADMKDAAPAGLPFE